MKKPELKTVISITAAAFILYLCIHYWPAAAAILSTILTALMPLLIGGIFAYLINILMSFYERNFFPGSAKKFICKSRRAICLILSIISLIALVALVISLIVPQLISCIKLLVAEIPIAIQNGISYLEQADILSEELMQKLSSINFQSEIRQIAATVFSGIGSILDLFAGLISSFISGITTTFLAIVFAIYLLIGKDKLAIQITRLAKRYLKEKQYSTITYTLSIMNDCFHRFVVGQCIDAVILGVLCTIGMLLLRLPYALMIGTVIAFTALIPIVGAFLGGIIGAFLIFMQSPLQALIFLIFLIILQQLEGDLIYPRVVGSSIGLPGIWVLAAVTVGGGVFGVFGMLIGVPIAATLYRLLKNDLERHEWLRANTNSQAKS